MYVYAHVYDAKCVKILLKIKKNRRMFLFFDFFMYICIVTKSKEQRYNEKNNLSLTKKRILNYGKMFCRP